MGRKKKIVKEEIVEKISFFKKIYNSVKSWIVKNGIEGILGLVAGLVLWVLGYKIAAGFSLGIFATRNWDILKTWVKGLLGK
jgi:hypothetical protein